jgi:dethiobiotin synthase
MTGRLVVITGTGTEIGKTHVTEAVLLALKAGGLRAAGLKPVESGGRGGRLGRDAAGEGLVVSRETLRGVALKAPVSPHRAARAEGVRLDLGKLAAGVHSALGDVDLLLVELPGGLFTPPRRGDSQRRLRRPPATRRPPARRPRPPRRAPRGARHDPRSRRRRSAPSAASFSSPRRGPMPPPARTTRTSAPTRRSRSSPPSPEGRPAVLATDPSVALIVAAIRR